MNIGQKNSYATPCFAVPVVVVVIVFKFIDGRSRFFVTAKYSSCRNAVIRHDLINVFIWHLFYLSPFFVLVFFFFGIFILHLPFSKQMYLEYFHIVLHDLNRNKVNVSAELFIKVL